MDADSGRVLYEHNADRKMLIASTTKILTALVAIEEGDLHDSVKVSREAAYTEGSAMYLTEGETLTLERCYTGCCCAPETMRRWRWPSMWAAASRAL